MALINSSEQQLILELLKFNPPLATSSKR